MYNELALLQAIHHQIHQKEPQDALPDAASINWTQVNEWLLVDAGECRKKFESLVDLARAADPAPRNLDQLAQLLRYRRIQEVEASLAAIQQLYSKVTGGEQVGQEQVDKVIRHSQVDMRIAMHWAQQKPQILAQLAQIAAQSSQNSAMEVDEKAAESREASNEPVDSNDGRKPQGNEEDEIMSTSTTANSVSANEEERERRSWRKNINLVLGEIENHKHGPVFKNPVKEDAFPGYSKMVYRPLDLSTIKQRIRDGSITSTAEFQRDVLLMCQNAMMVNSEGTPMYTYAKELKEFANRKIETFISTERMWKAKGNGRHPSIESVTSQ